MLVTVPNWLAGFNFIPQLMEEKDPGASLKTVAIVMVASVALGATFYCLVILSASMAGPWRDLLNSELPAAAAFQAAFESPLMAKTVLLAGLFGLLSTWNAVILAGSRLLFSLGRAHIIPTSYGTSHPVYRTPGRALIFICVVGIGATLVGRSILAPIINAFSTSFAFAFLITCLGVLKLRREQPGRNRPFRVPGGRFTIGIATIFCLLMFLLSLYLPWRYSDGIPLEWLILATWVIIGIVFWAAGKKFRTQVTQAERRELIFGELSQSQD